jgi:hypothetical protein
MGLQSQYNVHEYVGLLTSIMGIDIEFYIASNMSMDRSVF